MHDHHHHHSVKLSQVNRFLVIGIVLNLLFVILEVIGGLYYDSLALLSDAGHNFSDVIALVIALASFKLLNIPPNQSFTYGYRKTTVWAALANAILLFIAIGMILLESFHRWQHPVEIDGLITAGIAGVGILINGFTTLLFAKNKEDDLNVKGVYLHMLADTLVSVGVVISGLLIWQFSLYQIDTIISWVIVAVIIMSTWSLLKDSLRLSLDGVPAKINYKEISDLIVTSNKVISKHHLHIWGLSTAENALTSHIVVDKNCTFEDISSIKSDIKHTLLHHNIQHVTLEIEREGEPCNAEQCVIVAENDQHDHHHHH